MSEAVTNRAHEQGHVFSLLPTDAPAPKWAQITSVAVLPFDHEGRLVLAQLANRGIDIPGGHTEAEDSGPEQTAQREADEEVCVTLGPLQSAALITSTMLKNGQPTAMQMMTGPVTAFSELRFAAGEQSRGRVSLTPSEFLGSYRGGLGQPMMREILQRAIATYQPPAGFKPPVPL
jgi:hypothetical protein